MRVVLQPTGSKFSRIHYKDTIEAPVKLSDIESLLSKQQFKDLSDIYPDGKAYIWGVTNGKNDVNHNKWKEISKGDIAFFSANGNLFSSGIICYSMKNANLATEIWGINTEGDTWENIYFLDAMKKHDIPILEINKLIGYKDNFVVQGFMVLSEEKSEILINEYNFESDKHFKGDSKASIKEKLEKLYGEGTNKQSKVNTRREQKLLRAFLFDGITNCKCSICNEEYPIDFVTTAHIKKRKHCTEAERLDVENIVMPVCRFGCDELFEKGYIVVKNKQIIINKLTGILKLDQRINLLKNIECLNWTINSESYFEWHRKFHSYE